MRTIKFGIHEQRLYETLIAALPSSSTKIVPWRTRNAFRELLVAYTEEQRAYHTLEHIHAGMTELIRGYEFIDHRDEMDAAIVAYIYHDAVYDPGARDNEEHSVLFMRRHLQGLGVPERFIAYTGGLILLTKHTGTPIQDPVGRLLVDVDLKSLGLPRKIFASTHEKLKFEYLRDGVTEEQFREGTVRFCNELLGHKNIYYTKDFRNRFEEQALQNLEWLLNEMIAAS